MEKTPKHKPLVVYGARQIGKTTSIREFGKQNKSFIEINFVTMPQFKKIFQNSYEVNDIIKELSFLNPKFQFIENDTLIFFDEVQEFPNAVTSLKFFALDGRFDVICSASLLGVHYNKINSIPVGFKQDYIMRSLDFEEYLWANGYSEEQIEDIFNCMKRLEKLPEAYMFKLRELFKDYIFVGGMPKAVNLFVKYGTFTKVFSNSTNDISKLL